MLSGRTHVFYGCVALIALNLFQAFQFSYGGIDYYLPLNYAGIINALIAVGITTDLVAHLYKH